jgi:hypothetical protein
MKSARSVPILAAVLVFLLLPCFAEGHSLGIVRLRDAQGPFVITVFTSPELVSGRAVDISVLVQRRDSNEAILDAIVSFVLTPPRSSILKQSDPMCGQPGSVTTLGLQVGQTTILARREQSPNKLLYSASINFPLTGSWELDASVRHGADSAKFTCEIPVDLPARPFIGLVPFLALPLLLVTLFTINQWLRTPYRKR